MDNNWNFETLGTGWPEAMNRMPLSRQGSLYSWTLDPIQNNLGRDCGSVNMEDLPMNISSAEETQEVVPIHEGLQRQGSITTLSHILSQKNCDEVWKYIPEDKEQATNNGERRKIPQIQRQHTLGDITLDEFLILSGAIGNANSNPNTNVGVEFQQKPMVSNVLNNIVQRSRNHGSYLHPNVKGSMSTYQPPGQQQQQNLFQPQQPIMWKPQGYGYGNGNGYGAQRAFPTSSHVNAHGSFMGTRDQSHQENNNVTLVQSVATVPGGTMSVGTCSPVRPSDRIPKINVGSSLASPFPYSTLSGSNSVRDRKWNNVTTVEKTHKRKLMNRESATRARAKKLAQDMELKAEVEKLRKENHELRKKQAEMSKRQTKLGNGIIHQFRKQLKRTKSDSDIQWISESRAGGL